MNRSAKSRSVILAVTLLLVFALSVPASAESLYQLTGTAPAQKHGCDVGQPTVAQPARRIPAATRPQKRQITHHRRTARRSGTASVRRNRSMGALTKRAAASGGDSTKRAAEPKKVPQTEKESGRPVFISKITPAGASTTVASGDPVQSERGRKISSSIMVGIAGFSVVCAILYLLIGHRNRP